MATLKIIKITKRNQETNQWNDIHDHDQKMYFQDTNALQIKILLINTLLGIRIMNH